jgi:hypothetical protein
LTSGSTLNPGNGTINATKAGLVTLVATDTASSTHYINFTTAATGDTAIRTDTNLTYNPGTNTLTGIWFEGSFLGNASTATTAARWTTTRTISLTGDVTGSANIDGSGNISIATTVGGNTITLGDDTVGQYARTIVASGNGISITAANAADGTDYTVTSNATSANTANTIVFRDVNGNFTAGVMTGTATQARYADLAERYQSDKEYKPGTVVVFGGDKDITLSSKYMDRRVAGVVSTNPAHLMNSEAGNDQTHPPVALQGRVPCRVVGKIQKGDLLVTSSIPGVAIAAEDPKIGTVVGKALENYDNDHIGVIEVVVGRA